MNPITISSLIIIIFAGLIHASFQLSLSVLTLLSGHSIGKQTSRRRVLRLSSNFIGGVVIATLLLVSTISYYLTLFVSHVSSTEQFTAAIASGLMIGLGIATWAFYYRPTRGTTLWLPRNFAEYLTKRSKSTKSTAEAFSLGIISVVAEIIFIIAPILASSLAIITLPNIWWQISGIILYIILSALPLLIINSLINTGHSIADLQKWREKHKRFLQFASGSSLIILACFLFADRVVGLISYGGTLWL